MDDDKKIRKGICHNHGMCDKANNKEIQEIPEDKPFECQECHESLKEVDASGRPIDNKKSSINPKKRNKIIAAVIGCVVIGLVIAAIIVFAPGREDYGEMVSEGEEQPVETVETQPELLEDESQEAPVTIPVQEEIPVVKTNNSNTIAQTSAKEVGDIHKLSYGTWSGGWRNGEPNGNGTMTYTESHLIDSRDSKRRIAQPGEYIIGEWDNGHLVQGRWFKNDGTKEAVIIGKAG